MPGYEPFLLCDFHVHTTWSDGRLTDPRGGRPVRADRTVRRDRHHGPHPEESDLLGRAGRFATLGLGTSP